MIQRKQTEEISSKEWPDCFYETLSPVDRLSLLEKELKKDPSNEENLFRKKLFNKRYQPGKHGTDYTDLFVQSFLMMKVASSSGISYFQIKRQKKELIDNMSSLCILDFPVKDSMEQSLLEREWEAFLFTYCRICMSDHTYGSTLLGIIPMKKESISSKLANELEELTKKYPAQFDLSEDFHRFHELAARVFQSFQ